MSPLSLIIASLRDEDPEVPRRASIFLTRTLIKTQGGTGETNEENTGTAGCSSGAGPFRRRVGHNPFVRPRGRRNVSRMRYRQTSSICLRSNGASRKGSKDARRLEIRSADSNALSIIMIGFIHRQICIVHNMSRTRQFKLGFFCKKHFFFFYRDFLMKRRHTKIRRFVQNKNKAFYEILTKNLCNMYNIY